ncbi:hypothetical protein FRC19_003981 [Serendipita sp. 401]|nr:hypothetical protein FRC19_003981 [Serendipita sp. 401]
MKKFSHKGKYKRLFSLYITCLANYASSSLTSAQPKPSHPRCASCGRILSSYSPPSTPISAATRQSLLVALASTLFTLIFDDEMESYFKCLCSLGPRPFRNRLPTFLPFYSLHSPATLSPLLSLPPQNNLLTCETRESFRRHVLCH